MFVGFGRKDNKKGGDENYHLPLKSDNGYNRRLFLLGYLSPPDEWPFRAGTLA